MSDRPSKFASVPTTLLIDGPNILMRSVIAMGRSGLSADGHATGPLLSFIRSMSGYARRFEPAAMVVAWDGGSAFRRSIFPDYKANRPERGSEDNSAFALSKEFLTLAGIHHVHVPEVEADDIIAHYCQVLDLGNVVVVSGDKDLLQLVSPTVSVLRPGDDRIWTPFRVEIDYACPPSCVAKVLALAGDTSDGIPGVPRVGNKTAIKHLRQVDWDLDRLGEVHERYVEHADLIKRNLRLVTLDGKLNGELDHLGTPPKLRYTAEGDLLWPSLIDFVERYRLASIQSLLLAQALWPRVA